MKAARVLAALLFAPSLAAQPADTVVVNARVTTMDAARPDAEALAVRDGVFVAVGDRPDVVALAGPRTRVIDAGGRRVIPGLIDSHLHAVRAGRFYTLELRWDGVETLERGLEMIRQQAERTPQGQWVRVIGGWSPYQFTEKRMPTVAELNAAAPDVPVFVLFLYSQGFLNAAGVQALGLTPETPPPAGGRFEFVEGGGAILHAEPNPAILYTTIARLPELSPEDQVVSTRHFFRELNRFGVTSAIDAGGGGHSYPRDYEATRALAAQPGLPVRLSCFLFAQKPGAERQEIERWTAQERLNLNIAAARLNGYLLEGAGENLAWSAGDFENFMAARPDLSPAMEDELGAITRHLAEHRWPIRIHATYDESITRILNVFEPVFAETGYTTRWFIDHAETISDASIARVKALGGGIAIQNRMAYAGEYFADRYGTTAAAGAPPLRLLVQSGIPLGMGTDATRVSGYNPWVALHWLVTGETVGGTPLAGAENRLTREEALRLYTVGSAWFSGEEAVKGVIATGRFADLAVLSADYMAVDESEIAAIESVLTVTGGDVVHAAGPFAPLAPVLPRVSPEWSPVARFGGYQASVGAMGR